MNRVPDIFILLSPFPLNSSFPEFPLNPSISLSPLCGCHLYVWDGHRAIAGEEGGRRESQIRKIMWMSEIQAMKLC